jgi:hypothetical protein
MRETGTQKPGRTTRWRDEVAHEKHCIDEPGMNTGKLAQRYVTERVNPGTSSRQQEADRESRIRTCARPGEASVNERWSSSYRPLLSPDPAYS